jgi:hypothetical protein
MGFLKISPAEIVVRKPEKKVIHFFIVKIHTATVHIYRLNNTTFQNGIPYKMTNKLLCMHNNNNSLKTIKNYTNESRNNTKN